MSEITHLLVARLVDSLTQHLVTEVSDATQATLVKAYRFQDDPVDNPITLYVTSGDPDDPKHQDGRIGISDMEDLGLKVPSGEVGGGHLWWRRGRVRLSCFFIQDQYPQEVAADTAKIVLGRAMYWLENTRVSDLIDEFGERAYKVFVPGCNFSESGGPDNQYIWRGWILWQALTERPL